MKKKGFTLVELLAVIAILAILVIIALPNVMGMFNQAKKNSFTTEVKNIFQVAQQQWMNDSMMSTGEKYYARLTNPTFSTGESICGGELSLSGRTELDYAIKINKAGEVVTFLATDGTYMLNYHTTANTGLKIEEIVNAPSTINSFSDSVGDKNVYTLTEIGKSADTIKCLKNSATPPVYTLSNNPS